MENEIAVKKYTGGIVILKQCKEKYYGNGIKYISDNKKTVCEIIGGLILRSLTVAATILGIRSKKTDYNSYRKKFVKIRKKYFKIKKKCYHYTREEAYNNIKKQNVFWITNKNEIKDSKGSDEIEYPKSILKECLQHFPKLADEYLKWENEFNIYTFSLCYDKFNNYLATKDDPDHKGKLLFGNYRIKVNTKRLFRILKGKTKTSIESLDKTKQIFEIGIGYTIYNKYKQIWLLTKLLNIYYNFCDDVVYKDDIPSYENIQLQTEIQCYIQFLLNLMKEKSHKKEKEVRVLLGCKNTKNTHAATNEDTHRYILGNASAFSSFIGKI